MAKLDEALDSQGGFERALTLISASAGFGKTTLASHWIASCTAKGIPATWLSLDSRDNEYPRFILYLIKALQRISGSISEDCLEAFQLHEPQTYEPLLTSLVNAITNIPQNFIIVLDDYQMIASKEINKALRFLLEHLPTQMHIVMITREDPNLPLSRLRSRGQLTEIRAGDLAFKLPESSDFIAGVMNLNLSTEVMRELNTRTEGWIAGLQMAALSLQGSADIEGFMKAFRGSHRFILDYLVDEVLHKLTGPIRSFVLQSSILQNLCSSLCDAVTGRSDSKEMLETLDRGNLFILQLDDVREWYRFHHLFADVLQAYLKEEFSDAIPDLHRAAREWYEKNGYTAEAVFHSLAAYDFDHVAALAEREWQSMDKSFKVATWRDWVQKLPEELIRNRPVLCTQIALVLSDFGEWEASEKRLKDAEGWLARTPDEERAVLEEEGMVVADEEMYRFLPGRIAILRAENAQMSGDIPKTLEYAEKALQLIPESDLVGRAQAVLAVGFTHWINGDLDAAAMALKAWIKDMHTAGNAVFAIASTYPLADILIAQGRLHEAVETYKASLQFAARQDDPPKNVIAHLHLGLAMLYHETGEGELFDRQMGMAEEAGKYDVLIDWPNRWNIAQAQLKEAEGDIPAAMEFLEEAERRYVTNPIPITHPIDALKAQMHIRRGKINKAVNWMRKRGLSSEDDLSYLQEFEHITVARLLIEQYKSKKDEQVLSQAFSLLERLRHEALTQKRRGSHIAISILLALAHQERGSLPQAIDAMEEALCLSATEGYKRIFWKEGSSVMGLLEQAVPLSEVSDYARELLHSYKKRGTETKSPPPTEPLSAREQEVLRMLETELSGPEIADKLCISLNTMRTHTKNIYQKLGANTRRTAVRRAREYGLIP